MLLALKTAVAQPSARSEGAWSGDPDAPRWGRSQCCNLTLPSAHQELPDLELWDVFFLPSFLPHPEDQLPEAEEPSEITSPRCPAALP